MDADPEALLTGIGPALVALGCVLLPRVWRVSRHVVTIAHEGSHAAVARLTGRRLAGIRLHRDGSGLTVSRGRPAGVGMVATAAAGYVGPSVIGLGAAALLEQSRSLAVLWIAVVLLGLLLVQVRNVHGVLTVLLSVGAAFAVTWWAPPSLQAAVAHAVTWFLLLATPRTVLELQSLRRAGRAPGSDADVLARLTRIPGLLWVGLFLVLDVAALALGGWLLLSVG